MSMDYNYIKKVLEKDVWIFILIDGCVEEFVFTKESNIFVNLHTIK